MQMAAKILCAVALLALVADSQAVVKFYNNCGCDITLEVHIYCPGASQQPQKLKGGVAPDDAPGVRCDGGYGYWQFSGKCSSVPWQFVTFNGQTVYVCDYDKKFAVGAPSSTLQAVSGSTLQVVSGSTLQNVSEKPGLRVKPW